MKTNNTDVNSLLLYHSPSPINITQAHSTKTSLIRLLKERWNKICRSYPRAITIVGWFIVAWIGCTITAYANFQEKLSNASAASFAVINAAQDLEKTYLSQASNKDELLKEKLKTLQDAFTDYVNKQHLAGRLISHASYDNVIHPFNVQIDCIKNADDVHNNDKKPFVAGQRAVEANLPYDALVNTIPDTYTKDANGLRVLGWSMVFLVYNVSTHRYEQKWPCHR